MAKLLSRRRHEVHVCVRSADAWKQLDSNPVDLLILDTELEGEYGWEVLQGIRGDMIFRSLSVLVCSSNSRRDIVAKYINLGVQGIVLKPYSAERINNEIERAVATQWRSSLFESADSVQVRTGLSSGRLARLYRDAAAQIESALVDLQVLKEDPANTTGLARLAVLRSCGINVGFKLLGAIVDEARKFAASSDRENLGRLIDRVPVARRLLELHAGADPANPSAREDDADS